MTAHPEPHRVVQLLRADESVEPNPPSPFRPTQRELEAYVRKACGVLNVTAPIEMPTVTVSSRPGRRGARTGIHQALTQLAVKAASTLGHAVFGRLEAPALTLTGATVVLLGSGAILLWHGLFIWALLPICLGVAIEAIDGMAASLSRHGRRDVFVDYVTDRLTDTMLFGALAMHYWTIDPPVAVLAGAILLLALLSSYVRAQAEALKFESLSRFGRGERLFCLVVGVAGAAVLDLVGRDAATYVGVWLSIAALLTLVTLAERVSCVLKPSPTQTFDFEWDGESFLPRLIGSLVDSGPDVEIQMSDEPFAGGSPRVVRIRRDSGALRVRISDLPHTGTTGRD